jgi:hypothetical protein
LNIADFDCVSSVCRNIGEDQAVNRKMWDVAETWMELTDGVPIRLPYDRRAAEVFERLRAHIADADFRG